MNRGPGSADSGGVDASESGDAGEAQSVSQGNGRVKAQSE